MTDSASHRRYLVSGRVQGVGFRYFTRARARELGIRGWVRNLADGRVEVVASASERDLALFEQRLGEGPAGAVVHRMEPSAADGGSGATDFEIRYDPA